MQSDSELSDGISTFTTPPLSPKFLQKPLGKR
ncbi:unknown [[Mannheimia] succiniciproducens MBEL55E]|uniref:Uncharacterized protein n=1 Tax=Mannheimia succiniciproducens (strain KCTC 0769BP / MBEL55E) TaxID=221988 RepID=Q65SR4_MANSM|nr:unknown [[Mannheimia] succiniciproducens MBEL55E]